MTPTQSLSPKKSALRHLARAGALASALLGLSYATGAQAQAFDAVRLYGAKVNESGGTVGMAVGHTPKYMGSDAYMARPMPLLEYRFSNGIFAGSINGVGVNFSRSEGMQYGVRLTADLGRKESESSQLNGMGDIKIKPQIGGFFNYAITPSLQATSSLRYGSGNANKGLVADLGLSYLHPVSPQLFIGVGAATSYVNAQQMQEFFGVTAEQASRSGYAVYTPKAGLRDARANLVMTYNLSRELGFTLGLSANRLLSEAKNSPLTEKTSAVSAFGGVSYLF